MHISKAGTLGKKFYLCFQEASGKFGPKVKRDVNKTLSEVGNLAVVEASKSGKLTNAHADSYMENVFQLDVPDDELSAIIVDAWAGHIHLITDGTHENTCDPKVGVVVKVLPKSTTRFCQPLDVYFFRQYKIVIKRIVDIVRCRHLKNEASVKPNNRSFIIKMHAVVYNQFQSNKFKKMILYAWKKSGYTIDVEALGDGFENATQVLFKDKGKTCAFSCNSPAFLKCSHCDKAICLDHLLLNDPIHLHL